MKYSTEVTGFLKRHGFVYDSSLFGKLCEDFSEEMSRGLSGKSSSLDMIPTYISTDGDVDYSKNVIVIDAGGTNFRAALVHFDSEHRPVVDYLEHYPMPGTGGAIDRDEFYDRIVSYLAPIADKSDRIGFCFSFPTKMLPNRDGRLTHLNKEVKVNGLDGTLIGKGLTDALAAHGFSGSKNVVLINDTVATLLGGKASVAGRVYDGFIGFILGTGSNTCYCESASEIYKDPEIVRAGGSMIVNIESGGYTRAPRSDIDAAFDALTESPGNQEFEKMFSGAYQGNVMLAILRAAAAEHLFSGKTEANIEKLSSLSSKDIDIFCAFPYGSGALAKAAADDSDRYAIFEIIDAFFERAALYIASSLAAVMLKTGCGKNPLKPVCVSAEGTTFYKSRLLRPKLDRNTSVLLGDGLGLYCEYLRSDNTTLVGTALAGLL